MDFFETKPNRTYSILTIMKVLEGFLGTYAAYVIVSRFAYREPLSAMYITFPLYTFLSFMIAVDRICNSDTRSDMTVFEATVSLTGFVTHMMCVCILMYLLPRADYVEDGEEGKTTVLELKKFRRTIGAGITSTILASIYLLEGFLGMDILMTRNGVLLWRITEFPNPRVDLPPALPVTMIWPWEGRLPEESSLRKLADIRQRKKILEAARPK